MSAGGYRLVLPVTVDDVTHIDQDEFHVRIDEIDQQIRELERERDGLETDMAAATGVRRRLEWAKEPPTVSIDLPDRFDDDQLAAIHARTTDAHGDPDALRSLDREYRRRAEFLIWRRKVAAIDKEFA